MKRTLCIAIGLMSIQFAAISQNQITGFWLPEEGKSIIEIYRKDTDTLNGKIVWLERPTNGKGEPHTDKMNPDKTLQDRPLLGLDMLVDLTYDRKTWVGKLYTPKKGRTVDVRLSLISDDRLKVTVSFRGFTRNQFWTRTELPK